MDPQQAKQKLLAHKDQLTARVARTHKHLYEREERVSADFAEQSAEMENQELVMSLDAEGKQELKLINAALARIDGGTYGACLKCGKPISTERLNALPYASLCIVCAQGEED